MIDLAIKTKEGCTGCYSCKNICPNNCIAMIADEEGFRYPEVDYNQCIKCGKCIDTCPIINKTVIQNNPSAYACLNINDDIRLQSSSGGIFTLLAEKVIDVGGVVFGAGFNNKFEVEHSYAETKEDIEKFRGSKYVQSNIGDIYTKVRDFLKSGRFVLFSGTPCQIGGMKSYLESANENLLCVDIICHGVPSPSVWDKYIKYQEEKAGSQTLRINFRGKNAGWKHFSISFLFKNNTEYKQTFDKDLYMKTFLDNICLRPSCHNCKFKTLNRQSDITLADFWGIQRIMPEIDDDKGISLILVNTNKGEKLLDLIKYDVICKKVNIEEAIKYNAVAVKSVPVSNKRSYFFSNLNNIPFDTLVERCTKISYPEQVKHLLHKIGSKIKRTMLKK